MVRTKEAPSEIMGEANGMPAHSIGSRRVLEGPPIPRIIAEFLNSLRKSEDGGIDHRHPLISKIMGRAKRGKLDVVLKADGNGIHAVTGKNLIGHIDNKKIMEIGAGVAISTAIVAGVAQFVIRKHRRSKN